MRWVSWSPASALSQGSSSVSTRASHSFLCCRSHTNRGKLKYRHTLLDLVTAGEIVASYLAAKFQDDVAVALAWAAERLELSEDARIEPDVHAAIRGALRLNSDRSERPSVAAIAA
jgi:hypothetical protein